MKTVSSSSSISTASTSLNGSFHELHGANEQCANDDATVIGVLALQGAFIEHVHILERLKGVRAVQVRLPEDLKHIHGLVIPGGESTAISSLAERWGMTKPLQTWVNSGKPTWGTCAGMILLSKSVTGKKKEGQVVLGGLDTTVHRNYFGSQKGSFVGELQLSKVHGDSTSCKGVFIRAPVIVQHGSEVEVLATVKNPTTGSVEAASAENESVVVAVKQRNIMATAFHPELTNDTRWHETFVDMVEAFKAA